MTRICKRSEDESRAMGGVVEQLGDYGCELLEK